MEDRGGRARSALDCGSRLPLLTRDRDSIALQSAGGPAQSKTWRQLVATLVFAALPLISTFAQSYSIDWCQIGGGGGTSTGATYQVTGTIGQPDAGTMSGGNYTLEGGFWGVIAAVPTPAAPRLSITLTPSNTVVIAWPYPSAGFALEQNEALGTTNWASVTTLPVQVGEQWQTTVSLPKGTRFYRLRAP